MTTAVETTPEVIPDVSQAPPPGTLRGIESAPAAPVPSAVDAAAAAAAKAAGEEGKPDETKPDADEVQAVEYVETGDVGLDMALTFVGRLGIDDKHPAMVAAISGDFSLISAVLASKGEKAAGWQQYVALAEKSYKDAQVTEAASHAKITAAVHDAAGGAETWNTIQAWAKTEATPEERTKINALLSADPVSARAAVKLLLDAYEKKGYQTPKSATRQGASANGAVPPPARITRREAAAQTNTLARRIGGHNIEQSAEYQAIWARVG